MNQEYVLDLFFKNLPARPYCADELPSRLLIRSREEAIQYKYLQINHPFYQRYLILDLDYSAVFVELFYSMVGVPMPNLLIENPENGRAHLIFELETPIYKMNASRLRPIRFANAILKELGRIFNADVGYAGLITKNPFSSDWRTYQLRKKPYSLNELFNKLDLNEAEIKRSVTEDDASGLGRNCYLFETARKWAYSEVRRYRSSTYNSWFECVFWHCQSLNNGLIDPLSYSEIKGIAKSISRYCWKHDGYAYQEFIDRQTRKSKLGASKGGIKRSCQYDKKREKAQYLKNRGFNNKQIAKELNVHRNTVNTWLKCTSAPKSDSRALDE